LKGSAVVDEDDVALVNPLAEELDHLLNPGPGHRHWASSFSDATGQQPMTMEQAELDMAEPAEQA
jgi:hypothetical protein